MTMTSQSVVIRRMLNSFFKLALGIHQSSASLDLSGWNQRWIPSQMASNAESVSMPWCHHNQLDLPRSTDNEIAIYRNTNIHLGPPLLIWITWWRHQMETFSALLALCAGNSPVSGEFPAQRPVTRSFDVFFDLHLIKWLSKHPRGWWFETLSHPFWRHCNELRLGHGFVIITSLYV